MKCSELIDIVSNNDIAIYGAGNVAENFYRALRTRELEKRVKYFIETDAGKTDRNVQGVPVVGIKDIIKIKKIFICVAVHEAVKDEIETLLLKENLTNFVWICPYIIELVLGPLIEHHKKIRTADLIQHEPYDDYTLAVRYLAIENYYKKNNIGYDIYIKVLSELCHEAETAQKRLRNFIRLIEDWDKNGYRQEKDIAIDEKFRRIDGAHRVSLACYHRAEYIYYDLYPYSFRYNSYAGEWMNMSMAALERRGLSLPELDFLEQANVRLREIGT